MQESGGGGFGGNSGAAGGGGGIAGGGGAIGAGGGDAGGANDPYQKPVLPPKRNPPEDFQSFWEEWGMGSAQRGRSDLSDRFGYNMDYEIVRLGAGNYPGANDPMVNPVPPGYYSLPDLPDESNTMADLLKKLLDGTPLGSTKTTFVPASKLPAILLALGAGGLLFYYWKVRNAG